MSLASGKQIRAFIRRELTTNDKVIQRVNDLANKEKQQEMTQGYSIFEWIPGIPITDKDDGTQNEDDEIASTHGDEENDDITENGEEEK